MIMIDGNFDTSCEDICSALGMLGYGGLIDYNGHASFRLGDGTIAINTGASNRADLTQSDITIIDMLGRTKEGRLAAPRERFIHTEIYAARPDVNAIVHAHAPWSATLSTSGIAYAPVYPQGALLRHVPVFPEVCSINTVELGRAVTSCLGTARAAILQSHGIVVCGATMMEAVVLSFYLEENARRQMIAHSAGGCKTMSAEQIEVMAKSLWSPDLFEKAWIYFHTKWKKSP
jgi:L-ribulose-5-phosphate 4-epimerase